MNQKHSYGYLIKELAITDFKLKYQGSVLGYLWSFAKPLMLFGVLYTVFVHVLRFGNSPLPLLLGIVLWTYFADATSTAMASIVDRADLIRKVYFPRIIIVMAASLSSLITLALNLVIVLIFVLIFGHGLHWSALAIVPLLIELYVFALACSFFLSALYVRFRDFKHIWEVLLQIAFYATPIIYPLTYLPERYRPYVLINPAAQIIEDARHYFMDPTVAAAHSVLHSWYVFIPYTIPFVLLVIGYIVFENASANFAEEL